jgi:Leucine-rich repeat (LRR) protein
VPKDIKSKKIICNVTTEDFNYPTIVSFSPQSSPSSSTPSSPPSSSSDIECVVDQSKEWNQIGKHTTCTAKSFSEDALNVNFSNGDPTTQILAFSLNSLRIKDFPSNLNSIFDTKLIAIQCTDTKISEIHKEQLKPYGVELQYLDLSDNSLVFIERSLFKYNTNMKVIQLTNNNIAYIDGNVFDELLNRNKLVHATMSDNKCIDFDAKNEQDMKSLAQQVKGECNTNYEQFTGCEQ